MMKKITYIIGGIALTFLLTLSFPGCIDESFDDIAPSSDTTSFKANTTIAELKSAYPSVLTKLSATSFSNRDSIFIEGIVTSDDQAGNFYKTIVIQDETGAIEVKLEKTTLYNDYKRGQRLIIYCNDLYLGDYGGLIQLGSAYKESGFMQLGGIEGDIMIKKHVFRNGKTLVPRAPMNLTASSLVPSNLSKLVKVDDVEFQKITSPETGKRLTYADKANSESIDHLLDGCSQTYSNFVVRSSGYAKFANDTIPSRKGSIVGILSYYNGTYQLIIRDLDDVKFNNGRCRAPL